MFKPLIKTTVSYKIVDYLLQLVRAGKLRPGDKLPSERTMAEEMHVGRSTLREALKILAFNKVVEIRHGSGIFLLSTPLQLTRELVEEELAYDPNDPYTYLQTLEIRLVVEPAVARLVANCITDAELAELDTIIEKMKDLVVEGAPGGYAMEDMLFHATYPRASRNPLLCKMVEEYCVTNQHLVMFGAVPNLEAESLAQHEAIVEAFRKHDADLAEALLREHVYYSLRKNMTYIHNFESEDRFDILAAGRGPGKGESLGDYKQIVDKFRELGGQNQ